MLKTTVLSVSFLLNMALLPARAGLDLNGTWQFRFDEGRAITNVVSAAFEATGVMVVPGCFDALPGATYMKRGTALYRRTFELEKDVPADRSYATTYGPKDSQRNRPCNAHADADWNVST